MKKNESNFNSKEKDSKSFYFRFTQNGTELGVKMVSFSKRSRYASFNYQNERSDAPCYLVERDPDETEATLQKAIRSKKD